MVRVSLAQKQVNMLFAALEGDELGMRAMEVLRSYGLDVHIVHKGDLAPVGSICFYTPKNWGWNSKHLRVAAHRLYPGRPDWAVTTPFLVEMKPITGRNFDAAVFELARIYQVWFRGEAGVSVPWESPNNRPSTYTELLESWFDLLEEAVGADKTQELLSQMPLTQHRGRGGEVVYRMADTGRIALCAGDLEDGLTRNAVYHTLSGFDKPVVSYGTSDLANLFELFQTLKLGHHLGLPVVFETYPGAHNWEYWLSGFLHPSLSALRVNPDGNKWGLDEAAKYTALIPDEFRAELGRLGMTRAENLAEEFVGQPMWRLYQKAMSLVADEFLRANGAKVEYSLTTTEQIAAQTDIWKMSARRLAQEIHDAAGHGVVILNGPQGQQLRTTDIRRLDDTTVAQLHRQGWWLGGAALYQMLFKLGLSGGIVVLVKDSTAGRVNLMARPFLAEGSELYLAPVGLFRLTSEDQNEDWSIDPLVFWELMGRWGPEKTTQELQKVWTAMEVPLDRKNIGRKTVATVTQGGVSIKVEN